MNFGNSAAMNNTGKSITGWIWLAVGIALLFIAGSSFITANNYGARIEAQLKGLRDNNMNILAQGQQKVLEAAQVPEMARDDIAKIAKEAITGRYGAEGSKAVFQAINEQNPNVDPKIYQKIQQLIEAYRDEFKNAQTAMIDVRRQYEAEQGVFWTGMWLRIAGFPKVDMSLFKPITTDRVETTYANGKEAAPLKLR